MECILRKNAFGRRLLSLDDPRNPSHCWRSRPHCRLRYRPRTYTLIRGSACPFQATSIRRLLLYSRITCLRRSHCCKLLLFFAKTCFMTLAMHQSHIVEYSLSRRTTSYDTQLVTTTTPVVHASIPENPSTLTTGVTDTLSEAITTEMTPLLTRKNRTLSSASSTNSSFFSGSNGASIQRTRLLLAISYASFSGILSGMCLIFAKSGVELLVLSLRGHFQFWRWESWVLVLGLVVFALLQLWYLHKALVLADPTLVCPCTCHHLSTLEGLDSDCRGR